MRWKTKSNIPPKDGQKRARRVFAWKPTRVENYTVWLEFYWVHEKFVHPVNAMYGWWGEVRREVQDYYG